jgi:RimJ/RimL family protein N-acetyltransferase
MKYGFETRMIKNIIIRTRNDNYTVINICKKLGINYSIEKYIENNYNIDIFVYGINYEDYKEIKKIINNNENK